MKTDISISRNSRRSFTLHQWMLLASGFSVLLLAVRMIVTGTIEFCFLPWNLFLAYLPYGITRLMERRIDWLENRWKLAGLLCLWLLFVPNSFYIITDLFHFTHVRSAPKWFDLLLIFSFAWNGIFFGIVSLRRVEQFTNLVCGPRYSLLLIFIVMWLNALGIYIGRYLRFNSWDIVTDPVNLLSEISDLLINPLDNWYAWGMTGTYAVFMSLLYLSIRKMGETFRLE
ncbi:MAG: DUF1361 domain-containing protein [Chitinophagales bacterium]|nr:DUF1361 domain-containing protein [Chitinophagales bacterium]